MMKNRLIAIFLCLLMLAALLPAAVADEQTEAPADAPDEPVVIIEPEAEEPDAEPELAVTEPEEEPDAVLTDPEEEPDAVLTDPEEDIDAASVILINEANFPNRYFRETMLLETHVENDGNPYFTPQNIEAIRVLILQNSLITNVKGLEFLTYLQELYLPGTGISSFEISGLSQLVVLDISNTSISQLDLSHNHLIQQLHCNDCPNLPANAPVRCLLAMPLPSLIFHPSFKIPP